VRHIDEAAADVDLGTREMVNFQEFEPDTRSNDIYYGVKGTNLMEMNLSNINTVDLRLRVGQALEN
jgi:hypothetical protein